MERKVEAQRLEFQGQLEAQRKMLEAQNLRQQQEMETRFQTQISQAIQAHLPAQSAALRQPHHSPEQLARQMESQDARIQHLTEMIQYLVTTSPSDARSQPDRPSTGKRQAPPPTVVDLTIDHYDLENDSQPSFPRNEQGAKKRDTKETPQQDLTGNISSKLERTDSPAPSDLSMSMMEPTASQTAESLLWNGIHRPSEVYSPPAPPRTYRTGLDAMSPLSNLALHPNFRSPGTNFHTDNTVSTEEYPSQSTTPSFGESNFSEAQHMRDIHAQHIGLQGFEIHNGNAERPQEAGQEPANGPIEDDQGTHQATPVDGSTTANKHESL